MKRSPFQNAKRLENDYYRKLKQVCKQIDSIVRGMAPDGIVSDVTALKNMLSQYASMLKPWARVIATKMVMEVQAKDRRAWDLVSNALNRNLQREIASAPTGDVLKALLEAQVQLITSLPIEAANRVHELTLQGITEGSRAKEIAAEIMRSGKVSEGRAKCIARTEVARTASSLTQARAQHVGSTHYVWRTAGDSDVRKSHKEMNGKMVAWAEMPTLSDGTQTHAGAIYNCRCYPEPIIVDEE
jgi:SPP1 gp7 family putative phage head morphogenesis protein